MAGSDEQALKAEVLLGAEMAADMRNTLPMCPEARVGEELTEICRRLAAGLREKERTFQCELFRDEEPQAMALPGGPIFMSHSLVEFCKYDTGQLAFVLGHEMGHVIRRHAVDKILSETAFKVASTAAARLGPIGGALRARGVAWLRSAYSRDCEFEADEVGFKLAKAGGYEVRGSFDFLRQVAEVLMPTDPTQTTNYFASHPPARERLARLERFAAGASGKKG